MQSASSQRKFGIGQAPKRVEDQRFLPARVRYTGGHDPRGGIDGPGAARKPRPCALHAVGSRRGPAHAERGRDPDACRCRRLGDLPCPRRRGRTATAPKMPVPALPVLASDVARHVGDGACLHRGRNRRSGPRRGGSRHGGLRAPRTRRRHRGCPRAGRFAGLAGGFGTNLAFDSHHGDAPKTRESLREGSSHRWRSTSSTTGSSPISWSRAPVSRNMMARMRAGPLTVGSQGVHDIRNTIADHIPRWIAQAARDHAGCGRGLRHQDLRLSRNIRSAAVAARITGRPVAWIGERGKPFSRRCGRAATTLPVRSRRSTRRGRFLGLKIDIAADLGGLSLAIRPLHPLGRRAHVSRLLRHSRRACAGARVLHQLPADRRLSRRPGVRRRPMSSSGWSGMLPARSARARMRCVR